MKKQCCNDPNPFRVDHDGVSSRVPIPSPCSAFVPLWSPFPFFSVYSLSFSSPFATPLPASFPPSSGEILLHASTSSQRGGTMQPGTHCGSVSPDTPVADNTRSTLCPMIPKLTDCVGILGMSRYAARMTTARRRVHRAILSSSRRGDREKRIDPLEKRNPEDHPPEKMGISLSRGGHNRDP